MGKKRKGKAVRKNRERSGADEDADIVHAPHSFVIHRGSTGKYVQELCRDFRKVMEPFTASNIKVRPKNVIKDFVHVAGALNVSHMCMFTKTSLGPYFKVARFPRGPTLTFRVNEYALARDVRSSLKRQITYEKQFQNHPLLIMNGFTGQERQIQLMSSMFQNMFPSINVTKVKLNSIRRCVLLNYDQSDGSIEFRHYTIKVVPVGASRPVKKLVVQSKIPNLGRYDDISDVLVAGGNASESSEGEDEDAKVQLPQSISSRGNLNAQSSAVRLVELGPRIRLELIKIEEGLQDGEVLYHKLQSKTEEEKKAIRAAREKRKKEKEKRKKEQEMNVKRKQKEKELHKNKSLEGMRKKEGGGVGDQIEEVPEGFEGEFAAKSDEESDEDDDAKWYEREVGEAPDKDLFDGVHRKRKFTGSGERSGDPRFKKMRKSGGDKPNRGGGGQNDKSRPKFTVKLNQKSNFGAGGGGQNQYHGKTSKFGAGGASKSKFGNSSKSKFGGNKNNNSSNDRRDGGKKKRKTQVFNSQGVGPNFKRKGHK